MAGTTQHGCVATVTGAAGFLGSHLTRLLIERGWTVRAVIPAFEDPSRLDGLVYETVVGDVTDPSTLAGAFKGSDVVFHLAGIVAAGGSFDRMWAVNVDGVGHVIDEATAAGVPVVLVASVSALGPTPNDGRMFDETFVPGDDHTVVSYEKTKRAGMRLALDKAAAGARVRVACPGGIYGAGDTNSLSPTSAMEKFVRYPIPVFGPGDLIQCFVHVDDVADGLIRIFEHGTDSEVYVLVESTLTLGECLGRVSTAAGRRPAATVPVAAMRHLDGAVQRFARFTSDPLKTVETWTVLCGTAYAYTGEKARRELGWVPRPLDQGVGEVVGRVAAERKQNSLGSMSPVGRLAFPAMAALGASVRAGSVADRMLDRTGVSRAARRKIFTAAVTVHAVEAFFAWKATPDRPRSVRTKALLRTLMYGGPSLVRLDPDGR